MARITDDDIARLREEQQLTERFRNAADDIRQRLEDAEAMRRAALIDAGALTLAAQKIRDERGDIGIDVKQLAEIANISRPTLYQRAKQVADNAGGRNLSLLSTAELARLHLGYGIGEDDIAEELWNRLPTLGGWYRAYQHLARPGDDFDPWSTEAPEESEAEKELMRMYRQSIEKLAADPLGQN